MANTVAAINAKLAGTPMAGLGAAFVQSGARHGVDPAFLVSIAQHESGFGSQGYARGTNNAFGWGVHQGIRFPTWQAGIDTVAKGLAGPTYKGAGKLTPAQIINTYAPAGADGNNPTAYVQAIQQTRRALGENPNAPVFTTPGAAATSPAAPARAPVVASSTGAAGTYAPPSVNMAALQAVLAPYRAQALAGTYQAGSLLKKALPLIQAGHAIPGTPAAGAPSAQTGDKRPLGGPAPGQPGNAGYVSPTRGGQFTPERVDQGVDYNANGNFLAIGDAVVTEVSSASGWPGGGFVSYKLLSGPYAGQHVFVAEHVSPLVKVGQRIRAGQPVARGHGQTETGWAAGTGRQTYAHVYGGGYSEGQGTQAGKSFSDFLRTIGGIPGTAPTAGWRPGKAPTPRRA